MLHSTYSDFRRLFLSSMKTLQKEREEIILNRFDERINTDQNPGTNTGTGYLIVRVATARGAIPLENAIVNIREAATPDGEMRGEGASGEGALVAALRTDRDGLAPRVALNAPPRSMSESPGSVRPYGLYDIDVALDGYQSNYYQNVPIFDTVTSLQTVELIPLSAGERPELGQKPPSLIFRSSENEDLLGR